VPLFVPGIKNHSYRPSCTLAGTSSGLRQVISLVSQLHVLSDTAGDGPRVSNITWMLPVIRSSGSGIARAAAGDIKLRFHLVIWSLAGHDCNPFRAKLSPMMICRGGGLSPLPRTAWQRQAPWKHVLEHSQTPRFVPRTVEWRGHICSTRPNQEGASHGRLLVMILVHQKTKDLEDRTGRQMEQGRAAGCFMQGSWIPVLRQHYDQHAAKPHPFDLVLGATKQAAHAP